MIIRVDVEIPDDHVQAVIRLAKDTGHDFDNPDNKLLLRRWVRSYVNDGIARAREYKDEIQNDDCRGI